MNELGAQDACDLMQSDRDVIYVDVRSVVEFEAGHPKGAVNIPIMHFTAGIGMSPNDDFVSVVKANLGKDARVLVGCKTGVRSARACELMSQLGYTNVANVRGGFVGAVDNFGRVIEPGWTMLNLPLCSECGDEASYDKLLAKAQRA